MGHSSGNQVDVIDPDEIRNLDTNVYTSSTYSLTERLKKGWNRMREKSVPEPVRRSAKRHSTADIKPARIGRGVWKDQLLVDRSLRTMAALTTIFAIAMVIAISTHMKAFLTRTNKFSSSVGWETKDCKQVTYTNSALLFLINLAATMVLGMSNTYQQLLTSLEVSDFKYMLQKFGDSRVGTNSPFNINHKQKGKVKSWLAWLLLILTSIPIQ
jgi:hypothetical protein